MTLALTIGATDQTAFIRHESMTLKFSTLDLALVNPAVVPAIDDAVTLVDPAWSGVVSAVKVQTTVDKGTHKTVVITATNATAPAASAAPFGLSDTPNGTTTFAYAELKTSRVKDRTGAIALTGSLITYTAGIWPAMTFQLTSAAQGFTAQDFTARDVTVTWAKAGSPRYRIDFGDPIVTMSVWMNSALSGTIETTKITDGSVTTPKLAAGAVTADKIAALLILASLIKTADTGARLELDANGLRAYDSAGDLLVNIPTDGVSPVYVNGQIEATTLLVTGQAALAGPTNEISIGGVLQAAAQRQAPSQAPALTQGWDSLSFPITTADYDASNYYRRSLEFSTAGGAGGATSVLYAATAVGSGWQLLELLASDRSLNRSLNLTPFPVSASNFSCCRLGANLYVLSFDDDALGWIVKRYTATTLVLNATYTPSMPLTTSRLPAIASDGTNVFIVDKGSGSGSIKWNKYDATMVKVGSTIDTTYNSGSGEYVVDAAPGNADFGAFRMIVQTTGAQAHSFDSTGARQANEQFPINGTASNTILFGGITYANVDGSGARFWSHQATGAVDALTKHSTWTWTTASSVYWVGYTWNDSVGTTHETDVGPRASITMGRRKQLTVTTAALPGLGGADDPDGARIYMAPNATAPATTALKLQATGLTPFVLTTYNSGGAAPPVSNNFPAGTPAVVQSGTQPGWLFRGDGSYDVKAIARIQSRSTNPQSISTGTWTVLTYETADLADDTNLAIASGVVTVSKAGLYRVSGVCVWAANATGVRHFGIGINGSTPAQRRKVLDDATASGSNVTAQAISLLLQLSANDTVALYGQQNSGGNLNVTDALLNVERVSS